MMYRCLKLYSYGLYDTEYKTWNCNHLWRCCNRHVCMCSGERCKWSNKTPIYKSMNFYFFKLTRNTKVKVRSPDGDTEYFDIIAGVLQENTLSPYLFIICLDYELRTSIDKIKENGFELTKKRSKRYPTKTITDYADDIAILANTPNQAETLLHSLERAAAGIGLHVNAHKNEYMYFNQTGDISTQEGTSLKLVDKFTYLGSSVSSTEKTSTRG